MATKSASLVDAFGFMVFLSTEANAARGRDYVSVFGSFCHKILDLTRRRVKGNLFGAVAQSLPPGCGSFAIDFLMRQRMALERQLARFQKTTTVLRKARLLNGVRNIAPSNQMCAQSVQPCATERETRAQQGRLCTGGKEVCAQQTRLCTAGTLASS